MRSAITLAATSLLVAVAAAGIARPAHQSPQEGARVATEEVTYRNGDLTLAATLHMPRSASPVAAVVIVHGSGTSDRGNAWTAAWTDALARRGVAVLHTDKRGSGKSTGDWRSASIPDLAADISAAVRVLRSRPGIDTTRIGVVGFSQGGYVAAVLAAEDPAIAFAAAVSGGVATLSQQNVDEILMEAEGERAPLTAEEARTLRSLYAELFARPSPERSWGTVQARVREARERSPRLARALRTVPSDSTHWAVRWVRTVGDFDPMPYWKRSRVPVALVYGGRDRNVDVRATVARLWDVVGVGDERFSVLVLQRNGHGLVRDDAVDFLARWMRDLGE